MKKDNGYLALNYPRHKRGSKIPFEMFVDDSVLWQAGENGAIQSSHKRCVVNVPLFQNTCVSHCLQDIHAH